MQTLKEESVLLFGVHFYSLDILSGLKYTIIKIKL